MFGLPIFPCGALVDGFASNLLNLCNLRNLWIFASPGSGLNGPTVGDQERPSLPTFLNSPEPFGAVFSVFAINQYPGISG